MATTHKNQDGSHHANQNAPHRPIPSSSTATRQDRNDNSKRSEMPTTISVPAKSKPNLPARKSLPMQVYLRSDEPAARRANRGTISLRSQPASPQAVLGRPADMYDDTKELEEWMEKVTAHPERAMWLRDIDRVQLSTAQIYEALPLDEESIARTGRLRRSDSQESMRPMLFCTCCPPESAARRG